jgi:GGDEF domain-containing protein
MAEVTEVATEVVDKVVEETDHISEVSGRLSGREFRLFLAGVGVGAVAVAVAASIQERRLRQKYSQLAEDEIDQMREHFRARTVAREEKPTLEELKDVVTTAGYSSKTEDYTKASEVIDEAFLEKDENLEDTVTPFEELAPEVRNIFKDQVQPEVQGDGWNYETELARRDGSGPYVIHEDERGELDFSETEFTYYDGDDVTCDAENRIISKPEAILGSDFREKFGHGSNDPNAVFIRNGMIAADIEVSRMPGMYYSVEVQGLAEAEYDDYDGHRDRSTKFDDDD